MVRFVQIEQSDYFKLLMTAARYEKEQLIAYEQIPANWRMKQVTFDRCMCYLLTKTVEHRSQVTRIG
jgi:hypothetical protein